MLGFLALLTIGGMLAMPIFFDEGDDTAGDEPDSRDLEPEGPVPETPELPFGAEPNEALPFIVETDPTTGAVNITVAPDAEGRLLAVFEDSFIIPGQESSSGGRAYGMTLLWVPENIDFEDAANNHDWQTFFNSNHEAGIVPDRADRFAAIGVELVQYWDLGERSFIDSAESDFGEWPYSQTRFDDRTLLPDITANQEIEWYELSGQEDLLALMSVNAVEMEQALGPEDLTFDFQTSVESYPQGPWSNGNISNYTPEDNDVISGTEFDDVIDNPPGDPTAVTILGGAGEDKISAGLNDTIITDDDSDADTAYVYSPASFAQVYNEAPVIQAGPEDIIEIEAPDSLVITYAEDQGGGVFAYFYHVVSIPNGFELPSEALEADDAPLTLQAFYDAIGAELLARGSLGGLDQSDSNNVVDTRISAPKFNGVDHGFLAATLSGGTVTASTEFTSVTGVTAFV